MTIDRSDRRDLAQDVARAIESRRRRKKLILAAAAAALVALALLYLRCGRGWGIGAGGGDGPTAKRTIAPPIADAAPAVCKLRVDAEGVHLDGALRSVAEAVAACKQAGAAEIVVTGMAVTQQVTELRDALREAGVDAKVLERGVRTPDDRRPDAGS